MKIGIPRALLYYWYGHIWEDYLKASGFQVVVSPPTERSTLSAGSEVGVDELCLPMKICLGHLRHLAPSVDRLLIPHLIKVEKSAYICPKFMGLPDIVRHALPGLADKILILKVGPEETEMVKCLELMTKKMGYPPPERWLSPTDSPALRIAGEYMLGSRGKDQITLGIIGHPYCLYDSCFNLNLFERLADEGVRPITPELIPALYRGLGSGKLKKDLFWTIGRSQFDALEWMLNNAEIPASGFIQVVPFACGPEAIVGDMLERRIREAGRPYLKLCFEEHSGEAGVITRLEAFLDLVRYRSRAC